MNKHKPTIRYLYPDFTETELTETEDALERYLTLVLQIYERLEAEGKRSEIEKRLEK